MRRAVGSPLYSSSLFLASGPLVSSGLGFIFWIIAARITTPAAIGVAAGAIASANLLIAICDFGLATAVIRFGASARGAAVAYINTAIRLGWVFIVAAVGLFLVGIPEAAPGLISIRDEWWLALVFIGFTAFSHILALQDAAMISQGKPSFVFLRTLACNVPSVVLLWPFMVLVGGQAGLFAAYALPNIAVGLAVGSTVMPRYFPGYRMFGAIDPQVGPVMARFGMVNHVANVFWGLPAYALPIIALNTVTAAEAGRFFIVWSIVNLVLIVPRMVTYALFAELSKQGAAAKSLSRQALLAIGVISAPIASALWLGGDLIIGLFGRAYVNEALLRIMLLSLVPFTINSVWFVLLRAAHRLTEMVVFSAATAVAILVSVAMLGQELGIDGLAFGWLLGHSIAMGIALIGFGLGRRRGRHA